MTSSEAVMVSHCGHSRRVHSNGTPLRKPSRRGGSPTGVSRPPQFATRKMKKTTMCAVRRRLLLARNNGRISRTEAPVVPRRFASTAPRPSIPVFTSGVPESDPWMWMPPAITNSAPMTTMNATYSWIFSCNTARPESPRAIPSCQRTGSAASAATIALSRFQCHKQLWWRVHEPDAPELVPDPGLRNLLNQGTEVGRLAREGVPGGLLIDRPFYEWDDRVAETREALKREPPAIYEGTFLADE